MFNFFGLFKKKCIHSNVASMFSTLDIMNFMGWGVVYTPTIVRSKCPDCGIESTELVSAGYFYPEKKDKPKKKPKKGLFRVNLLPGDID